MVFLASGSKTYKVRVDHPDGRHVTLSTGCRDRRDASDAEELVHRWQGRKGKRFERRDVLDGLLEKRFNLPDVVEASLAGTLEAFLAAHAPAAAVVDLRPMLEAFVAAKKRSGKGSGQASTYEKQLKVLYPDAQLTLEKFSRKELWSRLEALEVDGPTRNRYRAAASQFAKYLVMAELLDRNFVREIEGYGENDPRLVYYEIPDAQRLVAGLEQPYAAIAALGLGFCAEWGAIVRGRVGDFSLTTDPVTLRVRGSKRAWRDRVVPLVPELAWTLDYIRPALAGKLPAASIVADVPEWRAIDVQRAAADSLELAAIGEEEFGQHSIHDWRHTHAVALLRWGYLEQIAADHLGHKDTSLVHSTYGRFKPTKHDYAKVVTTTVPTTSVKNHANQRGVK